MANVFEPSYEGIGQLLKSDWIMGVCTDKAHEIQDRFIGETEISQYVGKTRVNVSVSCNIEDNQNNELLKAVR